MKETIRSLKELLGTHENVADFIGYSDRGYRKIRKKIEQGKALQPPVEAWITLKYLELKAATPIQSQE